MLYAAVATSCLASAQSLNLPLSHQRQRRGSHCRSTEQFHSEERLRERTPSMSDRSRVACAMLTRREWQSRDGAGLERIIGLRGCDWSFLSTRQGRWTCFHHCWSGAGIARHAATWLYPLHACADGVRPRQAIRFRLTLCRSHWLCSALANIEALPYGKAAITLDGSRSDGLSLRSQTKRFLHLSACVSICRFSIVHFFVWETGACVIAVLRLSEARAAVRLWLRNA